MGPADDVPAGGAVPADPAVRPPSTFVTVLAWLGIIYHGVMLLVGGLEAAVFWQYFSDPAALRSLMPTPEATSMPMDTLWLGSRMFAFLFAGILAWAVVGLVASVGLLKRRNWGRITTIGLLALGIAWMALMLVWQGGMGSMPMPSQVEGMPDMSGFFRTMRILMAVLSVVFGVGYGWLIAKLVSKPIRAEFLPRGG
jgi:hypothetical protein